MGMRSAEAPEAAMTLVARRRLIGSDEVRTTGNVRPCRQGMSNGRTMEEKFFEEDCRPVASYNRRHQELYASRREKLLTLNAPFTLVGAMFGVALLVSILDVILKWR
jgi:hypothetical protein